MSLENLDGKYRVQSKTSYDGPFQLNSDGITEIKNGLTFRKDNKGCTWESSFMPIFGDQVKVESTVDPSTAPKDVMIHDVAGNPTRETVLYKSILNSKIVDGKIVMSGTIICGDETIELIMTQI